MGFMAKALSFLPLGVWRSRPRCRCTLVWGRRCPLCSTSLPHCSRRRCTPLPLHRIRRTTSGRIPPCEIPTATQTWTETRIRHTWKATLTINWHWMSIVLGILLLKTPLLCAEFSIFFMEGLIKKWYCSMRCPSKFRIAKIKHKMQYLSKYDAQKKGINFKSKRKKYPFCFKQHSASSFALNGKVNTRVLRS